MKQVLITGPNGFLGSNLQLHLAERDDVHVITLTRDDLNGNSSNILRDSVRRADIVFHLAGVNRPDDPADFRRDNEDLTRRLADEMAQIHYELGRCIPLVYTSSIQACSDSLYGVSKRVAEDVLFKLASDHGLPVHVLRLPNVFGKWSRPNYNSAVATFCHNIARDLPIQIHDPAAPLKLVYVDDLMDTFLGMLDGLIAPPPAGEFATMGPIYESTVGEVASTIQGFRSGRQTLQIDRVGTGFVRALYATYVSYLPNDAFVYTLPQHPDERGVFVEVLKTADSGQFSFFTAQPGVTRGGHFHHSKTEKFLVIRGAARFRFRHMRTGEVYEVHTLGERAQVVETIPGWTHDITNTGSDELVVMLWANEVFDPKATDTYKCPV